MIPVEAEAMISAVCHETGVERDDLMDMDKRRRHVSSARRSCWRLMTQRWSAYQVADWFGCSQNAVWQSIRKDGA